MALERAPKENYYASFRLDYEERRRAILSALSGFEVTPPQGTYFVMARVPDDDSDAFARRLIEERGVAAIPPASFYLEPRHGRGLLRFAFCKDVATIEKAGRLLVEG